jgi:hypothetical protein
MRNYYQRKEERIKRLKKKSEKLLSESSAALKESDRIAGMMQGEPIKVGHHSEKRHRKDTEKMHGLMDKFVGKRQQAENYKDKAAAAECNTAISSDNPDAIELLEDKISRLETKRDWMKFVNKEYRRCKGDIDGMDVDEKKKAVLRTWKNNKPNYESKPFQSFELTNLGARIKASKSRLESLKKKENDETTEIKFPGGKIVDNVEDNRLQIFHDEKPDYEIRKRLKQNGFRWAPSVGAWQRMRGGNAVFWAKKALDIKEKVK